jgi:two-component system, NtrC family, response regulator HydG
VAKLIAVINDDPAFLELMEELLTEEGYTVLTLLAEAGAYARVREAIPTAIILDIRLEHPDGGWNVLEEVRLDPLLATIPVIVCSANEREIQARAADLHRHRVEVLPKPFNLDELLTLLERLIGPGSEQPKT